MAKAVLDRRKRELWFVSSLVVVCLVAIALISPIRCLAQDQNASQAEESSSRNQQPAAEPDGSGSQTSDAAAAPSHGPVSLEHPPAMQQVGTAASLTNERSPMQWGHVYVGELSFIYDVGQQVVATPVTLAPVTVTGQAQVLTTNLVYDRFFRRSRFVFQYDPSVAIVNGKFENDLSSNRFDLNTYYFLSRRWSFQFSDSYTNRSTRLLYGDYFMDVNYVTGQTAQGNFLTNGGRYITNVTRANFNYQLNATDQITISPQFEYQNGLIGNQPTNSYTYGSSIGWTRAAGPTHGYGVFYTIERRTFSGVLLQTLYQTVGGEYNQRFGRTWSMTGSLGVSTARDSGGRQFTMTGGLTVMKTFRSSGLALTLSRNNALSPFLTNRFANRIDTTYHIGFSRNWTGMVSAGYQQSATTVDVNSGFYVTGQAEYHLNRQLYISTSVGRRWQNPSGGVPNNNIGNTVFFAAGIFWSIRDRRSY